MRDQCCSNQGLRKDSCQVCFGFASGHGCCALFKSETYQLLYLFSPDSMTGTVRS